MQDMRAEVERELDSLSSELNAFSLKVHAHPELLFKEFKAAAWLTERVEQAGFQVERGIAGLDTAFRASYELGAGGPTVAFLAEYDALPDLGHACGHNLICTAALGAALAVRKVLEGKGFPGRILLLGCPAEEGGGGKIHMLEAGVFDGVDVAMMFHPAGKTMPARGALAAARMVMHFRGKPSHAASSPEAGINALDACIQTFNAINAMRQHVKDETRIHGIITHGGAAPNIVPEYAQAKFIVRHKTLSYVEELKAKVYACARGAAASVGASVDFEEGLSYAERNNNMVLAQRFGANLEHLQVSIDEPPAVGGVGSSDIGNVSQVVPTIHPYIAIGPSTLRGHTREFAEASCSETGLQGMLVAAKALALTGVDVLANPHLVTAAWEELRQSAA